MFSDAVLSVNVVLFALEKLLELALAKLPVLGTARTPLGQKLGREYDR